MALNNGGKFEGKITCNFKNDTSTLANFYQSTCENLKIRGFIGVFIQSRKCMSLLVYRGVMCHENEGWYKFWRGIVLPVENWNKEFNKFWPEYSKNSNNYTLMGCFWRKYIMFELRKVQTNYIWWNWILMQNFNENWFVISELSWKVWQNLACFRSQAEK